MSNYKITPLFRSELKKVREQYNYQSTKLANDLGKGSSYISHIEKGKINNINSDMIESITQKISAKEAEINVDSGKSKYFEQQLLARFLVTLNDNYWDSTFYRFCLKYPFYLDELDEEKITYTIKEYLSKYNYTTSNLVQEINAKKDFIILYDINDTISKYIEWNLTYLDDILELKTETNYDDLFVVFYCLFEKEVGESIARNKAKEILLQYGIPHKEEVIISLKKDNPDLYEFFNLSSKLFVSDDSDEKEIFKLITDMGATLSELFYTKEDIKESIEIFKIFFRTISYPDSTFVFGILENDYTKITNRLKRKDFIKDLKQLVQKYSG